MALAEITVYVLVDSNGDVVADADENNLVERYEEQVQPIADAEGMRRIKLTITVPLPDEIEIECEVPDTEGEPTMTVK